MIKSMVNRVKGAVLGKEPDWQIVPAEELAAGRTIPPPMPRLPQIPNADGMMPPPPKPVERTPAQKEWDAVDQELTDWWVDKRVHNVLKTFVRNYASYGKASIQIYVPKGYLKTGTDGKPELNVTKSNLDEVLSRIYIDAPGYANVINAKDEDFGEDYVVLTFPSENPDDLRDKPYQVEYVDEEEKTHIRKVKQGSVDDEEIAVDLGGNLLTYVAGEFCDALISQPVKQQQRQLNHAKTMEGYAIANINFPETVFINAAMETETGRDPSGNTVKVVKPFFRGLGTFLNLIGVSSFKGDGSEVISTPDVKYKETADPEKFAKVADNNTRDMHQEASMLYVLLANSPYPSGDSRVEAMTDYLILLVDYKTLIDTVGVWLLQTVLRLAFNFTGQTEKNDAFAVLFSAKLTIGRISPDDKKIMLEEVAQKLRSQRNYMVTAEISDDPTMEWEAIASEPELPQLLTTAIPPKTPAVP